MKQDGVEDELIIVPASTHLGTIIGHIEAITLRYV